MKKLSPPQIALVVNLLRSRKILGPREDITTLSPAVVVETILGQPGPTWADIIETLSNRPIRRFPKGHSTIIEQDFFGRPITENSRPPVPCQNIPRNDPRVITLTINYNPKNKTPAVSKEASTHPDQPDHIRALNAHERFNLYRTGMTVNDYIKKGGRTEDIVQDERRGYISTHLPEVIRQSLPTQQKSVRKIGNYYQEQD